MRHIQLSTFVFDIHQEGGWKIKMIVLKEKKKLSRIFVFFYILLLSHTYETTQYPPPPPSSILVFFVCQKNCISSHYFYYHQLFFCSHFPLLLALGSAISRILFYLLLFHSAILIYMLRNQAPAGTKESENENPTFCRTLHSTCTSDSFGRTLASPSRGVWA